MSATPVREGLLTLRSEGFVETVPRRGFLVLPFTRQDVRDLFWVQPQLAGELASRAAKRITRHQIDDLRMSLEEHQKAIMRRDGDEIASRGHAFHRKINIAADSPRLAQLLDSVVTNLPNRLYAVVDGHISTTEVDHPLLLDALNRRASNKARALMEAHILDGADHLIAELELRGLWAVSRAEVI
ncbi:GntR family transcriptional regulator [Rhodococcus opacus]|uniref:GntR C-terminal domain-containing protein n=1 Tax=Rhodococcus opacus (strain B4) TaxID=632772 RepID=C1B5E7_RHOOB|nr:hypothetical protein ROP_28260 [Rhodococcus opacus B4]